MEVQKALAPANGTAQSGSAWASGKERARKDNLPSLTAEVDGKKGMEIRAYCDGATHCTHSCKGGISLGDRSGEVFERTVGQAMPDGWKPLTFKKIPKHTSYEVVKEGESVTW